MPRPSPVWGLELFLASYPPVIYDYPADKFFCHIPVSPYQTDHQCTGGMIFGLDLVKINH